MLGSCTEPVEKMDEVKEPMVKESSSQELQAVVANPFFEAFDTPFGVPSFEKIEKAHFMPALTKAMEEQRQEIAAIVDNPDPPAFENTVDPLDRSGSLLSKVMSVFFGLRGTNTDDEMEKIAEEFMPQLSKHQDDIFLDERLFDRIRTVYEKKETLSLNTEQSTLLEEYYQDFVRGGANLDAEGKAKLREINKELSLLTLNFGQNVLKETNRFKMVLDKEEDLSGLPDRVVAGAAQAAKDRGHEGKWVFTQHKPSLIPFLQYSDCRELREKMFKGYIERGNYDDELDNKENVSKIAVLRFEKAHLLGHKTYADFALDRRMARTPAGVYDLLNKLWEPALAAAKREASELQELIKKDGHDFKLEPWDWWYYAERLRKAKYDLDENELRPYFDLENVRNGVFDLATRLYGVQFMERTDIPIYDPEAKVFEVKEGDGAHIGLLYVDYFPRASKRGGAWCGGFREQSKKDGKKITPIVTNVGNFSKPTADKPALLSFDEVNTLFHEFGHAIHSLFSDVTYEGLRVKTDFVELPSQVMENWAVEPEFLKMYARHYETGEAIPDHLIEKIRQSRFFNQGFETVEYLAACFLDMDWHMLTEPIEQDVNGFEDRSLGKIGLIPEIVVRYRSPYFNHVFSGDYYSAGYYSYVWAPVLDADAYEAFKEAGLFDRQTAQSFRDNILSRGGSEDPMVLYKRFRGAEPDITPLLKRKGFQ